ncbi:MAG TPA: hypothetical protein EYP10_09295 [Armatimonadetes bacterium]|nr:hypothetical protein [Armatimonadota bacterium]
MNQRKLEMQSATGKAVERSSNLRRKRWLEPLILLALKTSCCTHGYEIARCVARFGLLDTEVERGAVYRCLQTLMKNGYVAVSRTVRINGRIRRAYRITAEGERWLERWVEYIEEQWHGMGKFLRIYRQVADG